jgi:hypothetical protein
VGRVVLGYDFESSLDVPISRIIAEAGIQGLGSGLPEPPLDPRGEFGA